MEGSILADAKRIDVYLVSYQMSGVFSCRYALKIFDASGTWLCDSYAQANSPLEALKLLSKNKSELHGKWIPTQAHESLTRFYRFGKDMMIQLGDSCA